MKLINIGFGNMVSANRLVAIVSPESAPIKRIIQDARDRGTLIDATYGRRTRAVIVTDSDHVILSAVQPETVANMTRTTMRRSRTMNEGCLLVLSGPSGCGKGTVVKRLLERDPKLRLSVSMTTRVPREGEVDGISYHFVTKEQFDRTVEQGGAMEYARCGNGDCYGTPAAPVKEWREEGMDVILEIDIQGYRQVKEKAPDAVGIFIMPPSFGELSRRLHERGTESEEKIRQRLKTGKEEIRCAGEYQYIVVNDALEDAVDQIEAILKAEHAKTEAMRTIIEEVLNDAQTISQ